MAVLAAPPEQPLARWLRLLWDAAPPLHLDSEAPFIADGGIHLPARPRWQQHCAAAAHAAAHLVYSPRRFEADGLVPTARALLALLEDARVEALAMRELPGLARLWRSQHTATPASGHGCEALMARLSRALADPSYSDPHPWVAKGRRLFYLDQALGLPALRTPAELRAAAMRLGHDIGQMRLPFNARGYRPAPAYRDDHRWMWPADQLQAVQPPPAPQPVAADTPLPPDPAQAPLAGQVRHHPEWDRLIRRLRPDWARVVELPAGDRSGLGQTPAPIPPHRLARQMMGPLRGLARPLAPRGRALDGEQFHLDTLLGWAIARRCGHDGDPRVHRALQRRSVRSAAWLLVDSSASSAAPTTPTTPISQVSPAAATTAPSAVAPVAADPTVLQTSAESAAATAAAMRALGIACTVAAFRSAGRHAVQVQVLQRPGDGLAPGPTDLLARLQALRPGGSTRLGAALRHAAWRLAGSGATTRLVLLLSDGQPHDIDVHDPRYLVDDARHAVGQARRQGIRMACITLGAQPGPQARRIFGRRQACSVEAVAGLPRALRRLTLGCG